MGVLLYQFRGSFLEFGMKMKLLTLTAFFGLQVASFSLPSYAQEGVEAEDYEMEYEEVDAPQAAQPAATAPTPTKEEKKEVCTLKKDGKKETCTCDGKEAPREKC